MSTQADLDRLRAEHGDRYFIRCTDHIWIATDRDRNANTEPTLMADSAEELAEKMANPGQRAGKRFPSSVYTVDRQAAHP
jgi:hypothetical protein